ncbi:MAG TPA: Flp family type IVb pilin [Candidatus Binataceae bacterium]|nr:Flp family type IVb pilin [Candidatus Binataceae bacterium]
MESILRSYLRVRESMTRLSRTQAVTRFTRGQTMTEYALIVAAVSIAAFLAYQTMGTDISALASEVDSKLSAAATSLGS